MADDTSTRVDTVTAHITAVKAKHGDEGWDQIMSVCLQDISLSLAMLVDAGATTSDNAET